MSIIDKKNIFPKLGSIEHIELELGCGNRKRSRQAVGIDMLDYPDVDIVGDVYEVLTSFPAQNLFSPFPDRFKSFL